MELLIHKTALFLAISGLLFNFSCTKETQSHVTDPIVSTEEIHYKTKGLFVFSENNQQQTLISLIDSSFVVSDWKIVSGTFFDARIDNKNQILYFFPISMGEMKAISTKDKSTLWSMPLQNNAPWFRGVELIDEELFVGVNNGFIYSYSHLNNPLKSIPTVSDKYFATHFLYYDKNTYTFQKSKVTGQKSRIVVNNLGLQIVSNAILDQELVKWFVKDDDEIFVFYNTATGYEIAIYYFLETGFSLVKNVSNNRLTDVARLSDYQFVLTTDKGIYLYDRSSQNSIMQVNNKEDIQQVDYNEDNKTLACLYTDKVEFYRLPQFSLFTTITLPSKTKKILWFYEKL